MSNLTMVEKIAFALGDLKEKMTFVGGSVAELYADFPETSDIRPTHDVDCVTDVQIATYLDYSKLENKLRTLGFSNDMTEKAPICRKIYQGIMVDFMPVNPTILGFSNRWYKNGIENRISVILPNGTSIYIFPVEYYVATKFEALNNRGGDDIRWSHDWEDIIYIMNNCEKLTNSITNSIDIQLVDYLQAQYIKLLNDSNIREIILSSLPYHSEEENIDAILEMMNKIKGN